MGCHTHYKKLVTNDRKIIEQKVRDVLAASFLYDWYEFSTLEELFDPNAEEWIKDIADYVYGSIEIYDVNGVLGIYLAADKLFDRDFPRIGGYPQQIMTSAKMFLEALENGLVNEDGKLCKFHYDKSEEQEIKNHIIDFFIAYPDGIVLFG